jgi:Transposase DDE domain
MSRKKGKRTIFGEAYEKFAVATPVAVMVRDALEHSLSPQVIDGLFEEARQTQYERQLLFSSVLKVFSEVVLGVHKSVHSAYSHHAEETGVSEAAFYSKLAGTDPTVCSALVHHSGREFAAVLERMGGALDSPLPGWEVRILDGNCPEATQRRLKVLREVEDRPLPGRAVAVLDPARLLILDAWPCEDGHAGERSLIAPALKWVQPRQLWIADRLFCCWSFIDGVVGAEAYFVLRQHGSFQPEPLEEFREVGRNASGLVSEQKVRGYLPNGEPTEWRRIRVQLDKPTRDGQREVYVLTNLPPEVADALQVAELYLGRWTIEHSFQEIEASLESEIQTLAYPRAALLALCLGFVAYNVLGLVKGAMRAVHGAKKVEQEVSVYYMAEELGNTQRGLDIAVPERAWEQIRRLSPEQLAQELLRLAGQMNFRHYKKHPRGPKKPRPPRRRLNPGNNVSTARLLAASSARRPTPTMVKAIEASTARLLASDS